MENPKKTPFYRLHVRNKAKIVEFAGYLMPIQFRGIMEEHRKVRSSVGLFDITHMGEFEVWGKDAESFIQRMTTNDVSKLDTYQVQYSCMCYDDGGIVDDLLVYRLPDHFLLVVNGACLEKDFQWLSDHLSGDVELKNVSEQTALLALQGPKAKDVLRKLTDKKLFEVRFTLELQSLWQELQSFVYKRIGKKSILLNRCLTSGAHLINASLRDSSTFDTNTNSTGDPPRRSTALSASERFSAGRTTRFAPA